MRRVVELCERTGLPFRKVSRLSDQLEHDRRLELREVAIEDLLGREPVSSTGRWSAPDFGARSVMITGAGGSIGSELAASARRPASAGWCCSSATNSR